MRRLWERNVLCRGKGREGCDLVEIDVYWKMDYVKVFGGKVLGVCKDYIIGNLEYVYGWKFVFC